MSGRPLSAISIPLPLNQNACGAILARWILAVAALPRVSDRQSPQQSVRPINRFVQFVNGLGVVRTLEREWRSLGKPPIFPNGVDQIGEQHTFARFIKASEVFLRHSSTVPDEHVISEWRPQVREASAKLQLQPITRLEAHIIGAEVLGDKIRRFFRVIKASMQNL